MAKDLDKVLAGRIKHIMSRGYTQKEPQRSMLRRAYIIKVELKNYLFPKSSIERSSNFDSEKGQEVLDELLSDLEAKQLRDWNVAKYSFLGHDNEDSIRFKIRFNELQVYLGKRHEPSFGDRYRMIVIDHNPDGNRSGVVEERYSTYYNGEIGRVARLENRLEVSLRESGLDRYHSDLVARRLFGLE
nr:hypothetical protein [Nanoarchaeum sp.]